MRIRAQASWEASGLPERTVQEVFDTYTAAGHQLLDLHEVHVVLAELSGCVVRRHPEGTYDANLEACCGCGVCEELPGEGLRPHGERVRIWRQQEPVGSLPERQKGYLKWLESTIEKAEPIEERSHGFRYRGQYEEEIPRPGNRKERLAVEAGKWKTQPEDLAGKQGD